MNRNAITTIICTIFAIGSLGCSSWNNTGDEGAFHLSGQSKYPSHNTYGSPPQDAMSYADAPMDPRGEDTTEPDNTGDKYEDPGTNPYVFTAADPQSTFAVDVDTASYDIFKRDMGWGNLPVTTSVRLEEYVNYFPYEYTQPLHTSEVPFAISVDAAKNIFTPGTTLLSIGIKGRQPPPTEKKPANLVFLIDVSGSMTSSAKLPLVKLVLTETLDILEPTDTISIVTYAGHTAVKMTPTPVSQKSTIKGIINSLDSGGSTNGEGGIMLAYEQAQAGFIDGGINHILLCTDGDFNVGNTSDKSLVKLIEEKRKSGVTLTVLGFGAGNLNDSMMEAITNAGNGFYGVIANEDHAYEYVHKRMLSTMTLIAKDVKIQVEFNKDYVFAYRLLGYENRAIPDHLFVDDTVDAGEIGAGHTVTALYELVLTGSGLPRVNNAPQPEDGPLFDGVLDVKEDELCRVKIRYKDVDATESDPAYQVDRGLSPQMIHDDITLASANLQWSAAIAAFAEILKKSPYGFMDNLDAIEALTQANAGEDPARLEFLQLYKQAKPLITGATQ
jgi:Ca-activated chloride channel family protein